MSSYVDEFLKIHFLNKKLQSFSNFSRTYFKIPSTFTQNNNFPSKASVAMKLKIESFKNSFVNSYFTQNSTSKRSYQKRNEKS